MEKGEKYVLCDIAGDVLSRGVCQRMVGLIGVLVGAFIIGVSFI